jgi:hypothetical protein
VGGRPRERRPSDGRGITHLGALRGKSEEIARAEVEKLELTIDWAVLEEVGADDSCAS